MKESAEASPAGAAPRYERCGILYDPFSRGGFFHDVVRVFSSFSSSLFYSIFLPATICYPRGWECHPVRGKGFPLVASDGFPPIPGGFTPVHRLLIASKIWFYLLVRVLPPSSYFQRRRFFFLISPISWGPYTPRIPSLRFVWIFPYKRNTCVERSLHLICDLQYR